MKFFSISRKDVMELGEKVRELEHENEMLRSRNHALEIGRLDMFDSIVNAEETLIEILNNPEHDIVDLSEPEIRWVMSILKARACGVPDDEILDTKEKVDAYFTDGKPIDL